MKSEDNLDPEPQSMEDGQHVEGLSSEVLGETTANDVATEGTSKPVQPIKAKTLEGAIVSISRALPCAMECHFLKSLPWSDDVEISDTDTPKNDDGTAKTNSLEFVSDLGISNDDINKVRAFRFNYPGEDSPRYVVGVISYIDGDHVVIDTRKSSRCNC